MRVDPLVRPDKPSTRRITSRFWRESLRAWSLKIQSADSVQRRGPHKRDIGWAKAHGRAIEWTKLSGILPHPSASWKLTGRTIRIAS
jgi:hypothetical protein